METGHFPFGRLLILLVGLWGLFMVCDTLRSRKSEEEWGVLSVREGPSALDWAGVIVCGLSALLLLGLVVADIVGIIQL